MEKKYIKYLILSQVFVIICIAAINYIIDPLLYYPRDKRVFPVLYTEEMRYLIPGLIKNSRGHNAVIIGASTTGNFLSSEIGALFNEKAVKLTIDGSTFREQSYVLSKYLDAHPDTKIVFWGIDPVSINKAREEITTQESYTYPFFLYNDSSLNLKYLLNYKVTIHSFQTIASNLFGMRFYMKTKDLNQIHTWPTGTQTGCNKVIEHYRNTARFYGDVIGQIFDEKNAVPNLNEVVNIVQKNKDVQFYMFLSPNSIVRYFIELEFNGFDRILKARNLFAEKTKGINNIAIIDLQASEDIISNLDSYKDMNHFDRTTNDIIIKRIVDKNFSGYELILENTEKLKSLVSTTDFEEMQECRP